MRVPQVAQEAVRALEAGLRAAESFFGREGRTKPQATTASARTDDAFGEGPEVRSLFISVKPQYADAILDGRKTVELRRTRPNLPAGSLVILYSSTPTRAVVGWAQLTGVRQGTPIEIWAAYGDAAAIEEVDYDAYFDGTSRAFALVLHSVVAAAQPIPLSAIRSMGIQPPQSWRYVPASVTNQIQQSALA